MPGEPKNPGPASARQNGRSGRVGATASRRSAGITAARNSSTEISSCRARVFGALRPSGFSSRMRANAPRGRITGSSNLPVAMPSRNSSRLATIRLTPKCCASGRITWSSPWLTSTTSAPDLHQFLHLAHASLFQARLQLVLEEFFAQQIEAVAGHSAQHGMHRPRGKLAVRGIKKRTQQGHQEDQPAPPEALGERLGIPRKERHGLDHGQVEQAALNPPVDGGGRTGIVVCRFQNW